MELVGGYAYSHQPFYRLIPSTGYSIFVKDAYGSPYIFIRDIPLTTQSIFRQMALVL